MSQARAFLFLLLASFVPLRVCADSWQLPSVKTYTSETGGFTFKVEPFPLKRQRSYFEQKSEGAADVVADSEYPKGRLSSPSGKILWERKLVNEVAPVWALVSADGAYVVTFDNWHSTGYGDDVVVIYGREGYLVRSLSLTDAVGRERALGFPRSVSSIQWSGEHRLESPGVLAFSVVADGSHPYSENAKFETVRIQLKDGAVLTQ